MSRKIATLSFYWYLFWGSFKYTATFGRIHGYLKTYRHYWRVRAPWLIKHF